MFVIGGATLGILFLSEPVSLKKAAGLIATVVGAFLVST
jgi:hypothetical protein